MQSFQKLAKTFPNLSLNDSYWQSTDIRHMTTTKGPIDVLCYIL